MGQQITQGNGTLFVRQDVSKIFVWNNRYEKGVIDNAEVTDVTLAAGTLLGRISATNKLKVLASASSDGSQFPVGILAETVTLPASSTNNSVTFCVAGDVVENKVILAGADTMATAITGRTIKDRIGADTVGIKLVGSIETTEFDNV